MPVVYVPWPSAALDPFDFVLMEAGWPAELWPQARAVATCESHLHADSVSAGGAYGVFQLMYSVWGPFFSVTPEEMLDPLDNSRMAYAIWQRSGNWSAWACSYVVN